MPTPFQIAILAWGCLVSAETCRALDPGPIPQWIWTNRDQARGASVELHRRFTLRELPKQASAWMLADDQADLLINGESALEVTGTHRIQPVDITRFLRVGTNELICRALNREGAAGIALALVLRPGQGPANVLVSDPQWWTLEENGEEEPVRSEGLLGNLPWGNPEGESEDYYQWKRALGKSSAQTPAEVAILPGFKIDLVRSSSPGEGSWVSLTFDDRGRIILGREGKGLLRYSPPPVDRIEVINDTLEECRGVLFAGR